MCVHWIDLDGDINKRVRFRKALHQRIVEFLAYMVIEGKGFDRGSSRGTDCITDAVEYSSSNVSWWTARDLISRRTVCSLVEPKALNVRVRSFLKVSSQHLSSWKMTSLSLRCVALL